MYVIKWSAPNIWVFVAQFEEHCSSNAEAMSSNPVEGPDICNCLNCDCNCDDHICISYIYLVEPAIIASNKTGFDLGVEDTVDRK